MAKLSENMKNKYRYIAKEKLKKIKIKKKLISIPEFELTSNAVIPIEELRTRRFNIYTNSTGPR